MYKVITWLISSAGTCLFVWLVIGVNWYWGVLAGVLLFLWLCFPILDLPGGFWGSILLLTTALGIFSLLYKVANQHMAVSLIGAAVLAFIYMVASASRGESSEDSPADIRKKCMTCGASYPREYIVNQGIHRCPKCGGTRWGWD